jgi:hypothetical protein
MENIDAIMPSVGYKKFPNNTFLLTIDDSLGKNGYRRMWSLLKDSEDIYNSEDNIDIGFLKGTIVDEQYDKNINRYDVRGSYVIIDDIFSHIDGYYLMLMYQLSLIATQKRWKYITFYDNHDTLYKDDLLVFLGFESKIDGNWVQSSSLVGLDLLKYDRVYHRVSTQTLKSKAQKLYE